ncbi:hypothetical protein PSACC_00790 [Paramicrosporidium saccamoebae]|uniref:RING-type E3 ubiquitin transferase n=1 Tax=Paramicrosporidium saccamoebae TaxID=1246581 RepID=A0A2H9TNZ2_9FUNG|nr:hypothetical protein PSACC_00790 [Paramicrosporidium saccamoebae]
MNIIKAKRLAVTTVLLSVFGITAAATAADPSLPPGGTVRVDFMHNVTSSGRSFLLTKRNSTMFSYNAPNPPAEGIWGELVPFSPLDACSPLQLSNYTRIVGGKVQFANVGPYPHVVALVARGNCSFEEKFDFVDNVPNVIGMLMFDLPDGDSLSNDIEISTFEMTSIPGFLVDYKLGHELLQQVNQMRSGDLRKPNDPLWVKVTLQYIAFDGPIQSILQFTLLFVMALLGVAFAASVYMHFHIYRLQQQLGARRNEEARNAIVIDEAFLEKLPVRKYHKMASDIAGVSQPTHSPDEKVCAAVEVEDALIHAHAPPNETCPICLDEFVQGEVLNELPCGHFYHMSCIRPWLQNRSPDCPMCKEDVRDFFIVPTDPVDPQTARTTLWMKTKGFFKKYCCCAVCGWGRARSQDAQSSGMTEVRIVTPTSEEHERMRDGTLHQIPLDQLANHSF